MANIPNIPRRTMLAAGGGVLLTGSAVAAATAGEPGRPRAAATAPRSGDLIARTPSGPLRGIRQENSIVWKGVRYAEPPTGNRRFAAPVPPKPWFGIRDATEFGPASTQAPVSPQQPVPEEQSEDCLFLNIYSPSTTGRRPVIVWIHGGVFVTGAGSEFDGTVYAERGDVVLVTINYRLHAFGYLQVDGRPGSGNTALLDQIGALRWVRHNIAAFGGNPRNVTVMGESAGGMSIASLLGAATTKGLFRRAIVQSSGARPHHTRESAARTAAAVFKALGISPGETAALLRVPSADIVGAATEVLRDPELGGEPFHQVVDGTVLPKHPLMALSRRVDVLVGTCRDESNELAKLIPGFDSGMEQLGRGLLGDARWDELEKVYERTAPAGRDPHLDLISAAFTVMPSIWLAEGVQRARAQAWQYRFDFPDASAQGPVHAADLPFTFGKVDPRRLRPGADAVAAQRLADTMLDAFASFARSGDPNTKELPAWSPITRGRTPTMLFDLEPSIAKGVVVREQRDAWRGVDPTLF